jgi:hypothetical protein
MAFKTSSSVKLPALSFCLLAWPVLLRAQAPETASSDDFACSYFGTRTSAYGPCDIHTFRSNSHAEQVIDNILRHAGMGYGPRKFMAVECPNVDNCYAARIKGVQYIVYDNKFLKQVEDWTHTDWAAISIMAHEVAHHLYGHTADHRGPRPENEKQADYFSGFVLHNLGASLPEAQSAIRMLTTDQPSATHPPRNERLRVIENGWRDAEALYPRSGRFMTPPVASNVDKRPNLGDDVDNSEDLSTNSTMNRQSDSNSRGAGMKEIGCISGDCTSGEGVFVHVSGERYEGDWSGGKRDGWGVHFYGNGKKRYEGQYVAGKRQGKGIYYFPNGDRYVGEFQNDHLNGKGTYYYANGDRYNGMFRNDRRNGRGTYVYANGRQEVSYYRDDAKTKEAQETDE